MSRRAPYEEISLLIGGVTYHATFLHEGEAVTVRTAYGVKIAPIGDRTPDSVARELLGELVEKGKARPS